MSRNLLQNLLRWLGPETPPWSEQVSVQALDSFKLGWIEVLQVNERLEILQVDKLFDDCLALPLRFLAHETQLSLSLLIPLIHYDLKLIRRRAFRFENCALIIQDVPGLVLIVQLHFPVGSGLLNVRLVWTYISQSCLLFLAQHSKHFSTMFAYFPPVIADNTEGKRYLLLLPFVQLFELFFCLSHSEFKIIIKNNSEKHIINLLVYHCSIDNKQSSALRILGPVLSIRGFKRIGIQQYELAVRAIPQPQSSVCLLALYQIPCSLLSIKARPLPARRKTDMTVGISTDKQMSLAFIFSIILFQMNWQYRCYYNSTGTTQAAISDRSTVCQFNKYCRPTYDERKYVRSFKTIAQIAWTDALSIWFAFSGLLYMLVFHSAKGLSKAYDQLNIRRRAFIGILNRMIRIFHRGLQELWVLQDLAGDVQPKNQKTLNEAH